MTAQPLPVRPDLDQLKRQAKDLLKALRSGEPAARQRWREHAPLAQDPERARLRDAQRVIAQEHGFASWDALRSRVADTHAAAEPVVLRGPLTRDEARRMAEHGVTAVQVESSVPSDSLAHLAGVPTLRRLDLSDCRDLMDRHLAFVQAMLHLEEIDLRNTQTGDGAAAALVGKRELSRVALGRRLTDAGVARLTEYPALNRPNDARAVLSVSSSAALTDQALVSIGGLAGVVELDLSFWHYGSRTFSERGVAHLKRMTALEKLNFQGALATDAVLHEIACIPRLRVLGCQDMVAGDEGFAALAESPTLEDIWGRWCHGMTERGFAALAQLPRLRKLCIGGRRVSDAAMASLVSSNTLRELWPFLFGDAAFPFIARIPRLEKLTNMYNRNTGDAATQHLRDHPTLAQYRAFGTQITDDSLRILGGLPMLEELEFENCGGITDAGLRELARSPRLRRVKVRSCGNVNGNWTAALRHDIDVSSTPGEPGESESYLFETLLDFPDLPIPGSVAIPRGEITRSDLLSRVVGIGCQAELSNDGLRLSVNSEVVTDRSGGLTRESFAVPLRIDVLVQPLDELRLYFGHHRFGLDEPSSELGWTPVTVEIDRDGGRLLVAGIVRDSWQGHFSGLRSRIGIGPRRSTISVRDLKVEPRA